MPYAQFHAYFPKTAEREAAQLVNVDDDSFPHGTYLLDEMYCDECDCRRAMIQIFHVDSAQVLATLGHGWGTRSFYIRWFGADEPDILDEMMGVSFPSLGHQSEYADRLLELYQEMTDSNPEYEKPLRRHHSMFQKKMKRLRKGQ